MILLAWVGESRVEIEGAHSRFELRSYAPDRIVWVDGREVSHSRLYTEGMPLVYRIFTTLEAAKRYAEDAWKIPDADWRVK